MSLAFDCLGCVDHVKLDLGNGNYKVDRPQIREQNGENKIDNRSIILQ